MQNTKEFLKEIIYLPTVTGFERMSAEKIMKKCLEFTDGFFNDSYVTKTGSIVLARKCGKKNARKLCFDAHLDTIGFAVSEICGGGYVRLSPLGGIDSNILPSSEVMLLGKEHIRGIFSSIPPHLSGSDKLPSVGELLCDTGFEHENLCNIVSVGTPAMFMPHFTQLLDSRISSVYLDDKICIAAMMNAVKQLVANPPENTDICCYLSSGEERGGNGSYHLYEEISPDALIVLDVNFAKEKGSVSGEYGVLSEGAMLSYSSVTSVEFTRFVEKCAKDIPLQLVNEMTYTGTNADVAARMGLGIPCAVMSVPIKYMHSYVETADLNDVLSASSILANVAREYDKSPACIPVYFKGGETNEL